MVPRSPVRCGQRAARPGAAHPGYVRHCAAVLARALAIDAQGGPCLQTARPEIGDGRHRALLLQIPLMAKAWLVLVEVPRRLRHELRDVRVDLVALGIALCRDGASLPRLLQLTSAPTIVARLDCCAHG
eukprot:scaffold7657_cov109-Isochrysis_galbana.AAC.3